MQNYQDPAIQRPVLKPKSKILTIAPKKPEPLTGQQQSLSIFRDETALTDPDFRAKKALRESIDYDKLTPTQQRRWDTGTFGRITLKKINGGMYYYLRWIDPLTNKDRSTYLGKEWNIAVEKQRKLTA
jgi:hypothetical protein